MPVQMIELEEMQMIEVSDDGLEASIGGVIYTPGGYTNNIC